MDKISGVKKCDDCKVLLDRCENELPDGEGVEPAEESGEVGLLIRHGWVNDALGKISGEERDIKDESHGVLFQ